ncbi:MAG: hypothetical protein JWQ21_785 [Herminiimonas sp.]|nr:hypothetical protein [Herminiimonas sp.]
MSSQTLLLYIAVACIIMAVSAVGLGATFAGALPTTIKRS